MPYSDGGLGSGSGDMQNYNNNRYATYDNRGVRWRGRESHAAWARNNYIDERGQLQGDFQYVPHSLSLVYQGIHDVRTYNYRDQVMRDASALARGANRLMGSYRPGGSAQMEAGTNMQAANLEMQRASMIQPMDLMGDYRRYSAARERRRRDIAFQQNLYAGIAAGIGSYFNPVYAGAAQNHFNNATEQYTSDPYSNVGSSQNVAGGGGGGQGQAGGGNAQGASAGQGGASASTLGVPGEGGQRREGMRNDMLYGSSGQTGASTLSSDQGGGMRSVQGGSIQGAGYGGASAGSGGGGGAGGSQGSAGASQSMGGGGYSVGSDGNFSSTARASYSAAQTPYLNDTLNEAMVTTYENDEFYSQLSAEIDHEMWLRRND